MKARTLGIVAAAGLGLAGLVGGCKGEQRELTPSVPTEPAQIQPEAILQEPQCGCQCTISTENDNLHKYLLGSDTRMEITQDYILATSKRTYVGDDVIQYHFLYDIKNSRFTETVHLFKRDGHLIAYRDTDSDDSSHDGLIDTIEITHLWGNDENTIMERNRDYEANQTMFDDADKILKEAREIFKAYNSYIVPGHLVFGN